MRKITILIMIAAAVLISCNREKEDFIWEYAGGNGTAFFIAHMPDSGFISAGTVDGNAYMLKSTRKGKKDFSYLSAEEGAYRAIWYDTAYILAAGASESQLLITLLDPQGNMIREDRIATEVSVSEVFLFTGAYEGSFVALCGTGPYEGPDEISGLCIVHFDTSGAVLSNEARIEQDFFRISGAVVAAGGGFIVSVTKATGTARPKASVMKIDESLQTVWERELINNPSYSAASLDVCEVQGGYVVSGRTELLFEGNLLNNSFAAGISQSGSVLWKKYPENSNEGMAVTAAAGDLVYLLNRNCFIISMLSITDGSEYRMLRIFNVCDSYDTEARAEEIVINHEGNILIGGSRGGRYYLVMKPVIEE
jgi:hypothetical protein